MRMKSAWKHLAIILSLACVAAFAALAMHTGAGAPAVVFSEIADQAGETSAVDDPVEEGAIAVVESDAAFGGHAYEAGVVLVDLVDWVSPAEAVELFEQETGYEGFKAGAVSGGYVTVTLPEGLSVADAVTMLEGTSAVGAAQPNFVYYTQADSADQSSAAVDLTAAPLPDALSAQADASIVNDPYASDQWAIGAMNLEGAWKIALEKGAVSNSATGKKRAVAVVDEGFYVAHEDLGAIVDKYNSHNAAEGATSKSALTEIAPIESNSHGTHVAGIVGARTNNGVGVAGVSYNAQLQLIKAAYDSGGGKASFTTKSLAAALEHVISTSSTYNTRVVNISVGGDAGPVSSFDPLMTKAIDEAFNKGIVVVCSAGNRIPGASEFPYENCPSDYATAVAVINLEERSSSADGFGRSDSSNYNRSNDDWAKDISAPGTSILGLLKTDGKYGYLGGTSIAAPQVAGAMSLVFAVNPGLTADEAVDILYTTATDLDVSANRPGTTFDSETGFGIVDAEAAVGVAANGAWIRGAASVQKGKTTTLSLSSTFGASWTWSSSNTSVARVSSSGVVTGVKAGVVVVKAKGSDGTTAVHAITVYDPSASGPSTLTVGETGASKMTSSVGGTWKWSSSNTSVAQVDSSSGKVAGKAAGTATITATLVANPAVSASYKVTVNAPRSVTVTRLSGAAALDTMRSIVKAGWITSGTVVIATDGGYWDGLTANGVAGLAGAPVVLTDGAMLSWQARDTIARLKPAKIVVCGGQVAISDAVVASAAGAAGTKPKVKRLWGSAADGTACSIYRNGDDFVGGSWSTSAFVCTDNGYWDALSAAPISYAKHMPIFLTTGLGAKLSSETLSAMKSGGIKNVYVVGGTVAVAPHVVSQLKSAGITVSDRIWGSDAVATSDKVARMAVSWKLTADNLGVATSDGYWDALAGAALCGKRGSALVIVDGPKAATISGFVKTYKAKISKVSVFGGTTAVSNATVTAIKNALR